MNLKHGTRIEVRVGGFGYPMGWEKATINTRVPKAWGTLPVGYHRVKYEDGRGNAVHESGFRVVDNRA